MDMEEIRINVLVKEERTKDNERSAFPFRLRAIEVKHDIRHHRHWKRPEIENMM